MTRRRPIQAVPDRPQRVVLYRRVSALMGRGGDDFLSPEIQLSDLRRSTAGMVEVGIIDDFDITGRTFDREGLDKIRAMVERGEVDAVAFYNVSRLGRNALEGLLFVAELEKHGVRILSATEHIDTSTAVGKMMLTNMLSVAQLQSDQIGESWSRTIAVRAGQGKHHSVPYGYRRPRGGRLEVDPVHGPIAADAFEAYARGVPVGQIAREVSQRRGKSVMTPNLKKWFRNPAYLGHVHSGGEIVVRDAHPPLVDPGTWERVQARLRHDTIAPPRHLAPTWALVGVIFCPAGHRLQRLPTVYRGQPVDRLVCGMGSSRGVGYPCEGIGQPRLAPVEAEVLRQIGAYMRLLRTDEAARAARQAQRALASTRRDELERELGRTRTAMAKLAKGWALGGMSDAEYEQPIAELRAAESELRHQLDALEMPVVTAAARVVAAAGERLIRLWPDATPAERSRMLRAVVRRVVVRRAAFWREPEADRVTVEF